MRLLRKLHRWIGLAALLLLIGAALLCAWKARRLFVRSVDRDCAAALLGGAANGLASPSGYSDGRGKRTCKRYVRSRRLHRRA